MLCTPSSCRYLFAGIQARAEVATYAVRATFLEVYNDELRDLLQPGKVGTGPCYSQGYWPHLGHGTPAPCIPHPTPPPNTMPPSPRIPCHHHPAHKQHYALQGVAPTCITSSRHMLLPCTAWRGASHHLFSMHAQLAPVLHCCAGQPGQRAVLCCCCCCYCCRV